MKAKDDSPVFGAVMLNKIAKRHVVGCIECLLRGGNLQVAHLVIHDKSPS